MSADYAREEPEGIQRVRAKVGIQAGLLAGLFVVVLFFLLDLGRLSPLVTPLSLSTDLWGPGHLTVNLPVASEALAIGSLAGGLLSLTLLHFLVFGILGLGAVFVLDGCHLPVNVGTGALYGLLIFSLAFYWSFALGGASLLGVSPGLLSVAGSNLLAGGVMGGYVQLSCGSRPCP